MAAIPKAIDILGALNTNGFGQALTGNNTPGSTQNKVGDTTGTSATQQPRLPVNGDPLDKDTTALAENSDRMYEDVRDRTIDRYRGIEQEQRARDPGTLYDNYYNNFATDGGRWGRANGLSYNQTLQLSREADAYNNRPTGNYATVKGNGAGRGVSVGYEKYDRPKIETEETREMQKSRELDLNQKRMSQALQDAVAHKDYDAYKQLFQAMYGIELSTAQAEQMIRSAARNAMISTAVFRDQQNFNYLLKLYHAERYANVLYDIGQVNSPVAEYMARMLFGIDAAPYDDLIASAARVAFINSASENLGITRQQAADEYDNAFLPSVKQNNSKARNWFFGGKR